MKQTTCPLSKCQCWGKRCSWWDGNIEACAIVGISISMRKVEDSLEELRKDQMGHVGANTIVSPTTTRKPPKTKPAI
jgi:hypothetical protein